MLLLSEVGGQGGDLVTSEGSGAGRGKGGCAKLVQVLVIIPVLIMAMIKGLMGEGVVRGQGGQVGALSIQHRPDAAEDGDLCWREEVALSHRVDGLVSQVEGHGRQRLRHHGVGGHNRWLEL